MKLRSPIVCAGISLTVLAGAYVIGCSEDDETLIDQMGKQPPGPPDAGPGDGDGAVRGAHVGDPNGIGASGAPEPRLGMVVRQDG